MTGTRKAEVKDMLQGDVLGRLNSKNKVKMSYYDFIFGEDFIDDSSSNPMWIPESNRYDGFQSSNKPVPEIKEHLFDLNQDVYGSQSSDWSQPQSNQASQSSWLPNVGSDYVPQPQSNEQYSYGQGPHCSWDPHVGSDYHVVLGSSTNHVVEPLSPAPTNQERVSKHSDLADPLDSGDYIRPPDVDYSTEQVFRHYDELAAWVMKVGRDNRYAIVTGRSNKNKKSDHKNKKENGSTPMEALENMLREMNYVFHTREDPKTNITHEIFFINPKSYDTWRAFPHVLMIDATYKTNVYKLPFVQMVGVTSTSQSFLIAHAFVTYEREDNFVWVLQRLKEILIGCYEPRVIITDRDISLVNACTKVFPGASHQLCRWHIYQNIKKHCRPSFGNDRVYSWDDFKKAWNRLCNSATPELYEYNRNQIFIRLVAQKRMNVMKYLDDIWLEKHRHMFVSAWTDGARWTRCERFGKKMLRVTISFLPVLAFHACRLEKDLEIGYRIPLSEIDIFWIKLDNRTPAYIDECEPVNYEAGFEEMKKTFMSKPEHVKKNIFSKLVALFKPSSSSKREPVVKTNNHGRPSTKAQEEGTRDLPRHSSYTGPQKSTPDLSRQRSYAGPRKSTPNLSRQFSYTGSHQSTVDLDFAKPDASKMQTSHSKSRKGKEIEKDPDISYNTHKLYDPEIPLCFYPSSKVYTTSGPTVTVVFMR
ncbi:hypothetical protein SSX86_029969 [Deinandra increscens subsp. villosa]|uniref:MULE transposase domain-containing protein n=1 Tax=Deinandra increscens subsp. villosa TaxID=3103831 RepID=A0AAP0CB57_9ASTR